MRRLLAVLAGLALAVSCDTRPGKHPWSLVASFGNTRIVYMSEAALADREFISRVLGYLVKEGKITTVQIFDSDIFVPHSPNWTEGERLHWRARYEKNPVKGFERFEWVVIVDPRARPIAVRFVEDSIAPAP